ncbi:MAG: NADH-ubiquinone oxidoreductase-F iron-sulfur binding region domain-containing protein, partial [Cyanobacteriota bacterium]|nr:NADH-ubiquinone oxidoreductase-F iron-sulfur binding region domain-containing protein [Cyanobacteriota bacterium]
LLDRFVEQRAATADIAALEELCAMVKSTSLCGLGQAAPNPVLSTLRHFRGEYAAACGRALAGDAAAPKAPGGSSRGAPWE